MPTRLRMPPLSSAGYLASVPPSSTTARLSAIRSWISRSPWPRRTSPMRMFSATVIESNSAANWNT
jgi:hypothetical protein